MNCSHLPPYLVFISSRSSDPFAHLVFCPWQVKTAANRLGASGAAQDLAGPVLLMLTPLFLGLFKGKLEGRGPPHARFGLEIPKAIQQQSLEAFLYGSPDFHPFLYGFGEKHVPSTVLAVISSLQWTQGNLCPRSRSSSLPECQLDLNAYTSHWPVNTQLLQLTTQSSRIEIPHAGKNSSCSRPNTCVCQLSLG